MHPSVEKEAILYVLICPVEVVSVQLACFLTRVRLCRVLCCFAALVLTDQSINVPAFRNK